MNKCIMSTSNDFYMPGENHQCERRGFYRIPGELGEYVVEGLVCKLHVRYLAQHGRVWVDTFRKNKIGRGQKIADLQSLYLKQSVLAELH